MADEIKWQCWEEIGCPVIAWPEGQTAAKAITAKAQLPAELTEGLRFLAPGLLGGWLPCVVHTGGEKPYGMNGEKMLILLDFDHRGWVSSGMANIAAIKKLELQGGSDEQST